MGLIKLAINRQTKQLVSFNGSVSSLPPFYQTNTQEFRIQIVDQAGGRFNTTYTAVDCSAGELRVILCSEVTGIPGDEASMLLAATYETGWAWDVGEQAFTGTINFATAEIQGHIGDNEFKSAILEVNLIESGVPQTVFGLSSGSSNVVIWANGDIGQTDAPSVTAPSNGVVTIQNGVGGVTIAGNEVTLAGLGLGFTPSYWRLWIETPAGQGFIGCNYKIGSGSAAGFTAILSAVPPTTTYKLRYEPVA